MNVFFSLIMVALVYSSGTDFSDTTFNTGGMSEIENMPSKSASSSSEKSDRTIPVNPDIVIPTIRRKSVTFQIKNDSEELRTPSKASIDDTQQNITIEMILSPKLSDSATLTIDTYGNRTCNISISDLRECFICTELLFRSRMADYFGIISHCEKKCGAVYHNECYAEWIHNIQNGQSLPYPPYLCPNCSRPLIETFPSKDTILQRYWQCFLFLFGMMVFIGSILALSYTVSF